MNGCIEFLDLKQDESSLWITNKISENDNLRNLIDIVVKENIRCITYETDYITSITDFVDELLVEEPSLVVLNSNKSNWRINNIIKANIEENYEDIKVIYLFSEKLENDTEKEKYKQIIIDVYNNKIDSFEEKDVEKVIEKQVHDEISKDRDFDEDYYDAMKNGYTAKVTGIYPRGIENLGTKHINVNCNITDEDYEMLNERTSINSALIFEKKEEEFYKNSLEDATANNYYLSHLHQVEEIDANTKTIKFDNASKKINIIKCKYEDLEKYEDLDIKSEDIKIVSIEDEKDLEKYEKDIDEFFENGKLKKTSVMFEMEDSCMWYYSNTCTIKNMVRFNITKDKKIQPCNKCSKCVGSINDDFFEITREIYKDSEIIQTKRNCSKCSVKDKCSKCVMLPEYIKEEKYCEFRRKYQNLAEYTKIRYLAKYLLVNSKVFDENEVTIEDVKFVVSKIYNTDKKEKFEINENIILFYVKEQPIIFNLLTNEILKISPILAEILEQFIRGYSMEDIEKSYLKDGEKVADIDSVFEVFVENKFVRERR